MYECLHEYLHSSAIHPVARSRVARCPVLYKRQGIKIYYANLAQVALATVEVLHSSRHCAGFNKASQEHCEQMMTGHTDGSEEIGRGSCDLSCDFHFK